MSLTNRLSAFFLAALALVLLGFSAVLYLCARSYLSGQLDERLEAVVSTLVAVAEVGPDGIEWDRHERHLQICGSLPEDTVRWWVFDDGGKLVDSSGDSAAEEPGPLRSVQRRLEPTLHGKPEADKHAALTIAVTASERPYRTLLGRIGWTLTVTSTGVWLLALVLGRWVCRRALRPVTIMASEARAMTAADHGERLTVPATQDEVAALGTAFNGLLDRLAESFDRQQRFTGDASHQLRTPLTALLGQVEVGLRHPRSADEYREILTRVYQQGEHLRRIVGMLLYLARTDAEGAAEQLEPVDLAGWLPEHLRGWDEHPRRPDLRLTIGFGGAWVQPALLGQLVDNLLENAVQYSEPGSPITVRLAAVLTTVQLTVEDEGAGIDAGDVPHVFEPFFRAASVRRSGRSGVGLGLSVALRIARLFRGTLTVAPNVPRGSRFTLTLPAAAVSVEDGRCAVPG